MWMRSVSLANYFYQLHKEQTGLWEIYSHRNHCGGKWYTRYGLLLVYRGGGVISAMALLWSSGDNFQALSLSFHQVGPGDQTQVVRLSCKPLHLLSHLPRLAFEF